MSRYALSDSCPNTARLNCWGVVNVEDDDYVTLPDGTFCYGLTHAEAEEALKQLQGRKP